MFHVVVQPYILNCLRSLPIGSWFGMLGFDGPNRPTVGITVEVFFFFLKYPFPPCLCVENRNDDGIHQFSD